MFAELGEQLDNWLYALNLRRIRLFRRFGLIPPPTPEERVAAEAFTRAIERINQLAPLSPLRVTRLEWLSGPNIGLTVNFRKYGELRTAAEALKDGPQD